MLKKLLPLCLLALTSFAANATELVIAENGATDYQIVTPDQAVDEVVDRWLVATAKLMQAAFQKNGFEISVVRESAAAADKPGIYLGATKFAQKNGIEVKSDDWSYAWKAVGPDVVIVGSDRKDTGSLRGKYANHELALLGTVKGALDFIREFAGVRFLFNNSVSMGVASVFGEDGAVPLDTRSIAFEPVRRIVIPSDCDLLKTPPLKARPGNRMQVNFYMIANNYFPLLEVTSTRYPDIRWNKVVSKDQYGKTHPEYFALLASGKRACEKIIGHGALVTGANGVGERALDVTNPDVLNLMFLAAEEQIDKGAKTLLFFPLDSYLLTRCNCDRCNAFFGIGAKTEDQVRARGQSGKLWQVYFSIAERIQKKYPEVKVIVWDYQEHPLKSTVVQEFPANVIPLMQVGTMDHFDNLKGINIPAGIAVLEETFTAFGIGGPYAPEHTPDYAARIAQGMVKHHVQWTTHDGAARVWGLQAPVYYVYGRILDDPAMDYKEIEKEFYTAAFGNAAWHMTQFFNLLHRQINLYSDFFGLYQPAWGRPYARARDNYNKWIHQITYTVEFGEQADAMLTAAERKATDPDVKARLRLIRIDFDYVNDLGKIFSLQDAWTLYPMPEILNALLDEVDAWHKRLRELAGGIGASVMQPLEEWPQMRPFNGNSYVHAALEAAFYQNVGWWKTAIGWDTAAIRAGALTDSKEPVEANAATAIPEITSAVWKDAPVKVLRKGGDMPYTTSLTTLKVLHDQNNLYARVDIRGATKAFEDLLPPKSESEVFKQEHVELSIQPKAGGATYRFAANPVAGLHYDAVLNPEEDSSWNGKWKFAYQINPATTAEGQAYRSWTAWFQIPFSDLGVAVPTAGETWKLDVTRKGIFDSTKPLWQSWSGSVRVAP